MNGKTALGMILTLLLLGTLGLTFNVGLVSGQGLTKQWSYRFAPYNYLQAFCPSPAVADLGINRFGGEPDSDLEIVTGTDEFAGSGSPLNRWHCFDSTGAEEWVLPTGCDQSRTSVAIADIDGDGDFEIAGGTTSGWLMEVFNNTGGFNWTRWPGYYDFWTSPAICDVNPTVTGLEVIAVTTGFFSPSQVFCFNGITGKTLWTSSATEFTQSSPACGDVDADGDNEVVIASYGGWVQCLNGVTGGLERVYICFGAPCLSSPALANVDADASLEVIIGSGNSIYCFDGATAALQWVFPTFSWVVSSPAVGDVDGDGRYEVVVGSMDSNVYCLDAATGALKWRCLTGGPIVSSAALANRGGFGLGIYIGSMDGSLYLLDGAGNLLNSFSTGAPLGITSSPAVADIDGDLKLEVMFTDCGAIGGATTFWVLEDSESTCISHAIEWQMFRHDPCRKGTYPKVKTLVSNRDLARVRAATSETDLRQGQFQFEHDVAITGIVPSKILTVAGEVINIEVEAKNKGDYTETFDVSVSYDGNTIGTLPVTLDAGASTILTFPWNTAGVDVGLYIMTAKADVVPGENEMEDNTFNGIMSVRNPSDDIATAYVVPSKTIVGQGYNATIDVILINQGDYTETFNVTAYADTIEIGKKTITLTSENSTTVSFNWNTNGLARGNYALTAIVDTVAGEDDTADNSYHDGSVLVTTPGNCNGDNVIDIFDCVLVALAFSSTINDPSPPWNALADITNDGIVDIFDIVVVALHFGETG